MEVVFQHLSRRPPFDEIAVRDGLRRRLNEIPGVELGENKLTRRPNFPLALLQGEGFERFTFALDWFLDQVGVQVGDPVTAAEDASEETFQSELIESCLLAQAEVGYDAQPFVRRVKDVGAVTAVKEILDRPYVSEALMALVDRGRPDLTIEALVCEPHYARLFTPE